MEKRLTNEQLDALDQQYGELTKELYTYRDGMCDKDYKAKFPKKQRDQIKRQFDFLKMALNEGLDVLMLHNHLKVGTGVDAIGNPFVKFKTKIRILRHLRHQYSKRRREA